MPTNNLLCGNVIGSIERVMHNLYWIRLLASPCVCVRELKCEPHTTELTECSRKQCNCCRVFIEGVVFIGDIYFICIFILRRQSVQDSDNCRWKNREKRDKQSLETKWSEFDVFGFEALGISSLLYRCHSLSPPARMEREWKLCCDRNACSPYMWQKPFNLHKFEFSIFIVNRLEL